MRGVPTGLVAHRIEVGDEEFILFEWQPRSAEPTPPTTPLTPAEVEVLSLIKEGKSNAQIAAARRASIRTVANQVASLLRKTGAPSRYCLMAISDR